MRPENIALAGLTILGIVFLWIFKRKVSYWMAPDSVISRGEQKMAFAANFFLALIATGFFHAALIGIFDIDDKLQDQANARILVVLTEFIVFIIVIGLFIENYFTSASHEFRKWKADKYSK